MGGGSSSGRCGIRRMSICSSRWCRDRKKQRPRTRAGRRAVATRTVERHVRELGAAAVVCASTATTAGKCVATAASAASAASAARGRAEVRARVERVRQRLRERHARVERCLRDRPRDNDLREEHRQHDLLAAEDRRADAVERLEEQQRQRAPPEREARARRSREHERPHDDERAAEAHRHAHVEPAPMRAAHGGHAAAVRAERCREPARDEQERVEPVESKAAARASRPTRARATLRGSLCGCEDKLIQEVVAARPSLESVCA